MPVKHHVALDRARKTAKTLARDGGITHQQALDRIAQEAGFRHWSDMAAADPAPPVPTLLLTGPEAPEEPASTGHGPAKLFFELDQFEYLRPPAPPISPTLAEVEAQTRSLMAAASGRKGLKLGDWVSQIMRDAAARARPRADEPYRHSIRSIPAHARMIAEALDPDGAPHDGETLTVRCPLHDDASGSLRITGTGQGIRMRCMAGCSHSDLQDRLISRLGEDSAAAIAFMADNDRSRVIGGHAFGRDGVGGAGGAYTLSNGRRHELNVLATRMLVDGYPVWTDGHVPRAAATLERTLRTAIAGRYRIEVTAPEDRAKGLWRYEVHAGHDGDYRILLTIRQGHQIGVNASHSGRFSVDAAETYAKARQAVDRAVALTRSFDTLDPVEATEVKIQHEREVARNARLKGTVNGWGWWAGPNPDEMTFGGPYKTKAEAISNGNGSCTEEGEHFYVVQARTSEPDDEGWTTFHETRGLKRCRCV